MKKLLILTIFLAACATAPSTPPSPSEPQAGSPPTSNPPAAVSCEMVGETLTLRNQTVTLPKAGRFVLESHLATVSDGFAGGRAFPSTVSELIEEHLSRSCASLALPAKSSCSSVYATRYHHEWTPPEGGKAGQGAVGDTKPTVLEEMWSGNLNWRVKPKMGTRYLATYKDKAVVVLMGWEVGPFDAKWLGGLQGEVMWSLGATDSSQITLGRLKDQSVPPGPVVCK